MLHKYCKLSSSSSFYNSKLHKTWSATTIQRKLITDHAFITYHMKPKDNKFIEEINQSIVLLSLINLYLLYIWPAATLWYVYLFAPLHYSTRVILFPVLSGNFCNTHTSHLQFTAVNNIEKMSANTLKHSYKIHVSTVNQTEKFT